MTMTASRSRRVPLVIPARDYELLETLADQEERTPGQQAAYLVRRALAASTPQDGNASAALAGTSDDPGPRAA